MKDKIPFHTIFLAVFIGAALMVVAVILYSGRPASDTLQPGPSYVKATGKCAQCHRNETSAVVHQFERSRHAEKGFNCLDCHAPTPNQEVVDHRDFKITKHVTADNCRKCHPTQYNQFVRSRHGPPAWAAVVGREGFTAEQIKEAEVHHPGAVDRNPNGLAKIEGQSATQSGCMTCHSVGKPNPDGSIGTCTECHSRHMSSVELARQPETCGQCHMGPDHAQVEIYHESRHGALFNMLKDDMNLAADPKTLTTRDMSVPTCATCHMSGLEGMKVTHDVTERLSYWLFAPVSKKRPGYRQGQNEMKEVCAKCHAKPFVDKFYTSAEAVVASTNEKISKAKAIMDGLRKDGLLTKQPFDEPIEFLYFDLWHYYGRTAKHGAFMGGADYVQWHGNYEILAKTVEIEKMAAEIRAAKKHE